MKLYSESETYKLYNDNMLNILEDIKPNSIDSIVTDPPYELNFMNKGWDNSGIAFQKETWQKCYEILKPGGYLLAFGGTRTYHRIACAIEDAGFEIRDCIMWLYGSGFPKSLNIGLAIDKRLGCPDRGHRIAVANRHHPDGTLEPNGESLPKYEGKTELGKEWAGWGTALKPAYEPIVVARKPIENSVSENVMKYGVGGINIDECRVGNETISIHNAPVGTFAGGDYGRGSDTNSYRDSIGRFPANIIHDGSDEAISGMPIGGKNGSISKNYKMNNLVYGEYGYCNTWEAYDDEGSASRYFYCAKTSKKDRDEGLDLFEEKKVYGDDMQWGYGNFNGDNFGDRIANVTRKNIHPTVKPVELMQYLVRLVSPKGATILDCFMGSGSTGKAVMFENRERNANYKFIGVELTDEYLPIAKARIEYARDVFEYELKQMKEKTGQQNIFDFIEEE